MLKYQLNPLRRFHQFTKASSRPWFEKWRDIFQWNYVTVYTEVSSLCNNQCYFCPIDRIERRNFISQKTEDWVVQLVKSNPKIRFKIFFHHLGEPLLYPGLENYIRKLSLPNAELWLSTNGILLTRERRDSLFEAGLRQIWFSFFYTNEEDYKRYTGSSHFFVVQKHLIELMAESQRWNRIHAMTMSKKAPLFSAWEKKNSGITFEIGRQIIDVQFDSKFGKIKKELCRQWGKLSRRYLFISTDGDLGFEIKDPLYEKPYGSISAISPEKALDAYLRSSLFLYWQRFLPI